jgi:DNA-binding XRE family transcriptional regulator
MARQPRELAEQQRALGRRLATFREAAGLYQTDIARTVPCHRTTVTHAEAGSQLPDADFWETADRVVGAHGALIAEYDALIQAREAHKVGQRAARRARARAELAAVSSGPPSSAELTTPSTSGGAEHDAVELARRVAASDVSTETLDRLDNMVDELAVQYSVSAPQELVGSVRRQVSYVMRLLDVRKTLEEHRRLLIVGGWLSLISATLYIDLQRQEAANSWLATAASLAQQTGQTEIYAWRYETEAWHMLTNGDYRHAVELSQAAQRLAPRDSSAAIQATAQEGRAWARLGEAQETYDALNRVERFVSRMAQPETPEHHYRYDPDKAEAYLATTLAWLGDAASEHYARHVVARFTQEAEAGRWPRRLAAAKIDLALALLLTDRLDEACAVAQESMLSGRLAASNHWRALEVVRAIEARGLSEASDLRETYELMRRGG